MSGYPGGMNSYYGHNMFGNGMGLGSYGMSGMGMPYNRLGSSAAYVGRYYSPFETFPIANKKAKKA